MSIRDYDLFIFDWDGTLSTSTLLVRLSTYFKNRYRKDHIKRHKQSYIHRDEERMKSTEGINQAYSILYDMYSAIFRPNLKDGALEILKELKMMNKKVAIFSDSREYRLMVEARRLGVLKYVDTILSASSVGYFKPNPEGLMIIVDKYKTRKAKTIYIGDMPSDMATAKFAGIAACGVGDGLGPYPALKEAKPDFLFRNVRGLLKEISH